MFSYGNVNRSAEYMVKIIENISDEARFLRKLQQKLNDPDYLKFEIENRLQELRDQLKYYSK